MPDVTAPRPFPQALTEQLIVFAQGSGHGVLISGAGLAGRSARAVGGAPIAEIDRIIDANGEDAVTQRRLLDRATFDATPQDASVILAHTYPWTYVTLLDWLSKRQDGQAKVVPISNVLNARR